MPPEHHKIIAKHVAAALGRVPRIIEMKAKGTKHVQAIAEVVDFPTGGLVAFATIGLSDYGGFELATSAPARYKSIIKAVFDVASYVATGHRKLQAGEIFEKTISRYYTKSAVGHWMVRNEAPEGLEIVELPLPGRVVRWLDAWPLTSDELVWFHSGRSNEMNGLLDRSGLAAFDIGRESLAGVPTFDPWARNSK